MKEVCIVVPVYNKTPYSWEVLSLQKLAEQCPEKYDICFVHPSSWTTEEYKVYDDIIYSKDTMRDTILHAAFDDAYFTSTTAYSSLLKNHEFYNRFTDFDYILIYQTDCFALNMNKLDKWVRQGFDYVGAPIITNQIDWTAAPCCGNGGLSLRQVSKFLYITQDDNVRRRVESMDTKFVYYEDLYFCEGVTQFVYIDMPSWDICCSFAWDMNPDLLQELGKEMPEIGIHAWTKNVIYWKDILDIPDDIVNDVICHENNK